MLIFLKKTMEEIRIHAQNMYPVECCGILLGKREQRGRIVYRTIPLENIAGKEYHHTHYQINPLDFLKIEKLAIKNGMEIVGFYHSHPDYDSILSKEDVSYMLAGCSYPIISIKKGKYEKISSYIKMSYEDVSVNKEEIVIE